ncbi:iron-containing alcohol dehydrogenase [Coprobacter fastidiosus]|uniref:iron-containing alcohol dehydrogenase n=1 Tax=Coprobacter fastidiosus TaxID=1099853 RepID=UPI0025E1CACB|nr:iron-containing alcohol dehydrogenase [Coprobacter fastidiosus]MBS6268720.1 iron-containing alcohol dehydrogenase [Tannerella sp.]
MDTKMNFDMYVPTHTLFGAGMLNNLHSQKMPGQKALLVISNGKSTKTNGYLKRTEEQLQKAGVKFTVFDQIEANPLKSTVMAGGNAARTNECDFIVALGGGSVMDASKAIAIMATNDGDYWDYIPSGSGKGKIITNAPLPIIAITTTAGTGSETDPGCVITNEKTHEKTGFVHPSLFPVLAIVDPELMLSVPPRFSAYQGFDALFHSVEAYVSNGANLMSDMYALTAIENVSLNLPKTIKNGNDIEARTKVAFGNTLSGSVMCVGRCNSEHSLEHAMSAYHQELPHGAGLIMISKAYFTHLIKQHVCDDRFIKMAKVMGIRNATEPMDFIIALTKLQEDCGVADLKMSDYGITPDEFEKFAINAKDTMGFLFSCDRIPLSNEDCINIYAASYK